MIAADEELSGSLHGTTPWEETNTYDGPSPEGRSEEYDCYHSIPYHNIGEMNRLLILKTLVTLYIQFKDIALNWNKKCIELLFHSNTMPEFLELGVYLITLPIVFINHVT